MRKSDQSQNVKHIHGLKIQRLKKYKIAKFLKNRMTFKRLKFVWDKIGGKNNIIEVKVQAQLLRGSYFSTLMTYTSSNWSFCT